MSFAEWNLIKPSEFVGVNNYTRAVKDPLFWTALVNTLMYVAITVPGQMILGLGIALLLDAPLRGQASFCIMLTTRTFSQISTTRSGCCRLNRFIRLKHNHRPTSTIGYLRSMEFEAKVRLA